MPILKNRPPKMCRHKATNQAYVMVNGRQRYLGKWGSAKAKQAYGRFAAEWGINGPGVLALDSEELKIKHLVAAYLKFAEKRYVRKIDGSETSEVRNIAHAVKPLLKLYGETLAKNFTPRDLKLIRDQLAGSDYTRSTVDGHVYRIRHAFEWGVSENLIPPSIMEGLKTVKKLDARESVRERVKVLPVELGDVKATLPSVRPVVAALMKFQYLTACRPGEACMIRPCDIAPCTIAGFEEFWVYTPQTHKNAHRGKNRLPIYIDAEAREILQPYLDRDPDAYCFSPRQSELARFKEKRDNRIRPLAPAEVKGDPRTLKRHRQRKTLRAGNCYTETTYRRAVHNGCDKAEIEHWNPNQLRHSALTVINKEALIVLNNQKSMRFAQMFGGHDSPQTTPNYVEANVENLLLYLRHRPRTFSNSP